MSTLLKLRRLNRKRAGLSHKKEWLLIDTLFIIAVSGIVTFIINSLIFGLV
jgi:hypothetical protein